MSRGISSDLVGGSNHSRVLDALKSRYLCVHEPMPAATPTPDDRRYLTSLFVFEDRETFEDREVDQPESPLPPSFSNLMVDQSIIDPHMIKEKIASVLKALKFREEHVLVQFWSPFFVRNRCLLTNWDQPFGLGVVDEELYMYRLKSELCPVVMDREYLEKIHSPGRVYSRQVPEWSLDTSYNIHGYINLPVFESSGDCCIGVLEIITSSSYGDFAFEVKEVSRELENQNLKSPNVFDDPRISIADERRQSELDEIFKALKKVCDICDLPLAQTWGPSGYSSYVANSENLEQSCSSFNRNCIGKVCMSTIDLPFCMRDVNLWEFHKACKESHLDKSQGVVGRSFSSCGTWFCEDVTKLNEDDYPLVHSARLSGLSSCLAIYLKSLDQADVEHVIEFFLPPHNANEKGLRKLMDSFKQEINNSSWMQLDIGSPPQVIGEVSFNWNFESPSSPITFLIEKGEVPPPESENKVNEPSNSAAGVTSQSVFPYLDNKIKDSGIDTGKPKRKRKRSDRMITYEEISKHFAKTMDEAATTLKVSRSTLKRICRNLGIARWPYKAGPDKSDVDTIMKSDQTDVAAVASEGTHTPTPVFRTSSEPFGGQTYITSHDPAVVTENGKHSSTHVPHQQEQTNLHNEFVQPVTAIRGKSDESVENVTIKVTYGEIIIKFACSLKDGLVKLEEMVATRLNLRIGSFRLRYLDEDGDMISIACDDDLKILGGFTQPDSKAAIKLSVQLVAGQTSDA